MNNTSEPIHKNELRQMFRRVTADMAVKERLSQEALEISESLIANAGLDPNNFDINEEVMTHFGAYPFRNRALQEGALFTILSSRDGIYRVMVHMLMSDTDQLGISASLLRKNMQTGICEIYNDSGWSSDYYFEPSQLGPIVNM